MTKERWKKDFSNNLKYFLKERGMTQEQLAKDSGVAKSQISDYINAKTIPSLPAILNISRAFGIKAGDLVDFGERVN